MVNSQIVNKVAWLLACVLLLAACKEDEQCRMERYVRLYAGFYQMNLNAASGERTEGRLDVDTLSVQGVGLDGYIYDRAPRKDSVQLVLNNQADVSEFVLTFEDTLRQQVVADTLSVYYRRTESYLSFECGCLYTFTLDTALTRSTRHFIDSIVINSIEVNTANVENIKIYHTP